MNAKKKILFVSLLVSLTAVLLLLFALPASAQEPTMDEVNAVARKLNCPTCQGVNLEDCRTQTCAQWRDQIRDFLAQGMSEREILDWYAARYGDEVLQEPPRRGVGLLVWVLPVLAIVTGTIWLITLLRKWAATRAAPLPAGAASPSPPVEEDEYLRRVEQELRERDV